MCFMILDYVITTAGALAIFKPCYHKCINAFFDYQRFDSVTIILFDLSLPRLFAV